MQKGFYFDQARCTGCFACSVACKDLHSTPPGPANWMQIKYREAGNFPRLFVSHEAIPCYHCANPVCSFVCPNDAISKREEDGVVIVDSDKCRSEPCGIIDLPATGHGLTYGAATAPCQTACPVSLDAPAYIALIAKGKNKEALEVIRRTMPLPSVCGRICVAPCESACSRREVDDPVAIMALKRFAHDNTPYEAPERVEQTEGRTVAIVGSGPAGLGAAYDLIRKGYGVTVFEALPVIGGMLTVGGPTYRVSREALKKDIDYIEALGVEFKTGAAVDLGTGPDDLMEEGYSAVLLAVGAHRGIKQDIPGTDFAGGWVGTTFLRNVNLGNHVEVGKQVAVVGDGNTALDCARAARRLGAETVRLMFRKAGFEEAAGHDDEKQQTLEEGVLFEGGQSLTRVLGEEGKITGVESVSVKGPIYDEKGRRYETVEGSEKTTPADTVIFAIGQLPDLAGLSPDGRIRQDENGTVGSDPETMMTDRPGVFSAGDSDDMAGSVVHAIASGQRAASFIHRYLQGDVVPVRPEPIMDAADIVVSIPAGTAKAPRRAERMRPVAERLSTWDEVVLGFDAEAAVAEAERCLNCAGHLCKDACAYSSPQFTADDDARMQKCDLCYDRWGDNGRKPICVEACPPRALDAGTMEELTAKYGSAKDAVGFVYSPVQQPSIVSKAKKRPAAHAP